MSSGSSASPAGRRLRVLVVGLGVTGEAVVRHLTAEGASVVVIEDRADAPGGAERLDAARGAGARVLIAPDEATVATLARDAELVVPSPGVPERHPAVAAALAAGIPVRSEVDLAAERARVPLVAITGTNGKSTVTMLVAHLLEASGVRAIAAGNLGTPLLDAVDGDADIVVAEVSSFQLRFAETLRPRVAVLLNVADDHLDWHGGFDAYADAKARVFEHQRGDDLTVYVADDANASLLVKRAPARRVAVTTDTAALGSWRAVAGSIVGPEGQVVASLPSDVRRAPYAVTNVLAAVAAATEAGATADGVAAGLADFRGLPHRLVLVGQHEGVLWYDDSKATNPHATVAAVEGFDNVVLIAGGRNKGIDLGSLRHLAPHLRHVVAIGEAAPEVMRAFSGVVPVTEAASMDDAIAAAATHAGAGDVVLLSPACASFDWYDGYAARGDDFVRGVRQRFGGASEGGGS